MMKFHQKYVQLFVGQESASAIYSNGVYEKSYGSISP